MPVGHVENLPLPSLLPSPLLLRGEEKRLVAMVLASSKEAGAKFITCSYSERSEARNVTQSNFWAMVDGRWQTLLECELYLQSTLRSGYQTWCADLPSGYLPLHQHL